MSNKTKKLPVYDYIVNEDDQTGIFTTSVVKAPALEIDFTISKFSKEQDLTKVSSFAKDMDKRTISGPLLIPDLYIYRNDQTKGEHYAKYSEKSIRIAHRKMMKNLYLGKVNIDHTMDASKKMYITECWMVDYPEMDKSKALGYNLPQGSLFASVFVDDQVLWDDYILTGELKGFSVEILVEEGQKVLDQVSFDEAGYTISTDQRIIDEIRKIVSDEE